MSILNLLLGVSGFPSRQILVSLVEKSIWWKGWLVDKVPPQLDFTEMPP